MLIDVQQVLRGSVKLFWLREAKRFDSWI